MFTVLSPFVTPGRRLFLWLLIALLSTHSYAQTAKKQPAKKLVMGVNVASVGYTDDALGSSFMRLVTLPDSNFLNGRREVRINNEILHGNFSNGLCLDGFFTDTVSKIPTNETKYVPGKYIITKAYRAGKKLTGTRLRDTLKQETVFYEETGKPGSSSTYFYRTQDFLLKQYFPGGKIRTEEFSHKSTPKALDATQENVIDSAGFVGAWTKHYDEAIGLIQTSESYYDQKERSFAYDVKTYVENKMVGREIKFFSPVRIVKYDGNGKIVPAKK